MDKLLKSLNIIKKYKFFSMSILQLTLALKNSLRKRKGLYSILRTYRSRGMTAAFIGLIFLIISRLKIDPIKFIISRNAIFLYKDSKHLTLFEKIILSKKNQNKNNSWKLNIRQTNILEAEEI